MGIIGRGECISMTIRSTIIDDKLLWCQAPLEIIYNLMHAAGLCQL